VVEAGVGKWADREVEVVPEDSSLDLGIEGPELPDEGRIPLKGIISQSVHHGAHAVGPVQYDAVSLGPYVLLQVRPPPMM
jgi:hypothetical protein